MAVFKRLRRWMRGETSRPARGEVSSRGGRPKGNERSLDQLADFAASRQGVEGFLEPRTALYDPSLLFVADDGEHLRRSVPDPAAANELCRKLGVPLYDARKVGYPQRMRDYVRGERQQPVDLSELPPWPQDDPPAAGGGAER